MMSAMPIIPIEPAKDVSIVLPFFVKRFFSDSPNDVPRESDGFFMLSETPTASFLPSSSSLSESGAESDTT